MASDSRIEKWQRWLKPIQQDVIAMNHRRHVYETIGKIVEAHGSLPPSSVLGFISHTYVVTEAVAIRRQAEASGGVTSLGNLLAELESDASRLCWRWFSSLYEDGERGAEPAWSKNFAGSVREHADPELIQSDRQSLAAKSAAVKQYVDKHFAHLDVKQAKRPLTFGDIHVAIDELGRLFRKYALLLTASDWVTLVPIAQYDWLAIFTEPWIKDDQVLFDLNREIPGMTAG
jgi:hypothetical protein